MEDMKTQIELRVIAAQVSDWCNHKDGIVFDPSLSTQERILRFQTPLLTEIFPNIDSKAGAWKSGRFLMYEIYNGSDEFKITCSVSLKGMLQKQRKEAVKLIEYCGASMQDSNGVCFLKEWTYPQAAGKLDLIMKVLQDFSESDMLHFESELLKWKRPEDLLEEILTEGGMKDILTNKYERNPSARKRCIEFYGTACRICGFDFGKVYGQEFVGKIHVHHKLPLSEIREDSGLSELPYDPAQ